MVCVAVTVGVHLCRPTAPEAAIFIGAEQDRYVPADSVAYIHRMWKGSELRYIPGGHVSSFVFADMVYRRAVQHALSRLKMSSVHASTNGRTEHLQGALQG